MTMRYGCDIVENTENPIKEKQETLHLTSYIQHKQGKNCTNESCECNCDKTE